MKREQREPPAPRRATDDSPASPRYSPWQRIRLDTPVELLARANVIIVAGDQFLIAGIDALVQGVLALDLHPIQTWRNGGDWPKYRKREVPGFTTLESLGLAAGVAPEAAFFLPSVLWRQFLMPHIVDGNGRITATEASSRLPRDQGRRAAAVSQVDEIRAQYGKSLTDIAYRIENSALFDSGVPTTRQFETALALFSDVTQGTTDDEVVRRSAVVNVAFTTARLHAETVGLGHLPTAAHDGARRAAGAARLARSSPSEPERQAAELLLIRILRSLAIDSLPDPTDLPRAITAGPIE